MPNTNEIVFVRAQHDADPRIVSVGRLLKCTLPNGATVGSEATYTETSAVVSLVNYQGYIVKGQTYMAVMPYGFKLYAVLGAAGWQDYWHEQKANG
jgi:hypothetical protein